MKPLISIGINLIAWRSEKLSGAGKYMQRLFRAMQSEDTSRYAFTVYLQQGIDPSIFCIPDTPSFRIVRVPRLGNPFVRMLFEQTLFRFYIRKCDAMFSPLPTNPLWGDWKNIITIHDLVWYFYPNRLSFFKRLHAQVVPRFIARKADQIVTVSENSRNDIVAVHGVAQDKINVVYNFILPDEPVLSDEPGETGGVTIRMTDGREITFTGPYFLSVSSLQPHKNIRRLLEAFDLFRAANPGYKLCIVGDEVRNYRELYDFTKERGLTESVVFTGYLDDCALGRLYTHCTATVYISLYEGFGIPPLEGFYHGKTCVVSGISSLPEVVGRAGIYVDPYDAGSIAKGLETCLRNGKEYTPYIGEQIAKFQPGAQIEKLFHLFGTIHSK